MPRERKRQKDLLIPGYGYAHSKGDVEQALKKGFYSGVFSKMDEIPMKWKKKSWEKMKEYVDKAIVENPLSVYLNIKKLAKSDLLEPRHIRKALEDGYFGVIYQNRELLKKRKLLDKETEEAIQNPRVAGKFINSAIKRIESEITERKKKHKNRDTS